jgi:hypothetical protein
MMITEHTTGNEMYHGESQSHLATKTIGVVTVANALTTNSTTSFMFRLLSHIVTNSA